MIPSYWPRFISIMEIVYDGLNSTPPQARTTEGHHEQDHPRTVPRVPFWLRWLVPVLLVLTWLAIAGIGGPTFGRLEEVSSNDQASFLPGRGRGHRGPGLAGQVPGLQ